MLFALATCALAIGLAPGAARGTATEGPPPVPDCYHLGSGYGTCEGNVIPGDGSIAKLTIPDKRGIYSLRGPAPLQFTKSVACGDAGCVYNHLSWSVGLGASVVSGCVTNTSTCNVRVAAGGSQWAPVYVRQNNDPPQIWLIWSSGKKGFKLSGTITAVSCASKAKSCSSPAQSIGVAASGAGGGSTFTDSDGHFSMMLPKGSYTVTPHGSGNGPFKPGSRKVSLSSDVGGIDFTTTELEIQGSVLVGCARNCSGTAKPIANVAITATGAATASATTDIDGAYTIKVPKGHYTVTPLLAGYTFDPVVDQVSVDDGPATSNFLGCSGETVQHGARIISDAAPKPVLTPGTYTADLPSDNALNPQKFSAKIDCFNTVTVSLIASFYEDNAGVNARPITETLNLVWKNAKPDEEKYFLFGNGMSGGLKIIIPGTGAPRISMIGIDATKVHAATNKPYYAKSNRQKLAPGATRVPIDVPRTGD
ncbi:MAG TPA: hypothetical protein VGM80_09065 [Gaiellaceae bacterium]